MTSHSVIVWKFHAWCTGSDRVLKRSTSIINELDIPWDPGIDLVFNRNKSLLLDACARFESLLTAADPSRKLALRPPP